MWRRRSQCRSWRWLSHRHGWHCRRAGGGQQAEVVEASGGRNGRRRRRDVGELRPSPATRVVNVMAGDVQPNCGAGSAIDQAFDEVPAALAAIRVDVIEARGGERLDQRLPELLGFGI